MLNFIKNLKKQEKTNKIIHEDDENTMLSCCEGRMIRSLKKAGTKKYVAFDVLSKIR